MKLATGDPRLSEFRRLIATVSHAEVIHPLEKDELLSHYPIWRRSAARQDLRRQWEATEDQARPDIDRLVLAYESATAELDEALKGLQASTKVNIHGKISDERTRVVRVRSNLAETRAAAQAGQYAD